MKWTHRAVRVFVEAVVADVPSAPGDRKAIAAANRSGHIPARA